MEDNKVRVRFAPSPTGLLHLGNVRTAIFNWLFAKKNDGVFILRIEDTDRERSKEEYSVQICEDLKWLGLDWDEGPIVEGPYGPYNQASRIDIYDKFARELLDKGLAYKCFCTPEELQKRRAIAKAQGLPPRYDNKCRNLAKKDEELFIKENKPFVIRFKVPDKLIKFKDIVKGEVSQQGNLLGDFVIVKSDGMPSFHFAVVIDDSLMKVSHVIRGDDHLSNTFLHILLYEAINATPPQYAHMSLTKGIGGALLSKREGGGSISAYRKMGYPPAALTNYLSLLGWAPRDENERFLINDIYTQFNLKDLSPSPSIFDEKKLNWIAKYHMSLSDNEFLYEQIKGEIEGKFNISRPNILLIIQELKKSVPTYIELCEKVKDTLSFPEIKKEDMGVVSADNFKNIINFFISKINESGEFSRGSLTSIIKEFSQSYPDISKKEMYTGLRVGLTGRLSGPELILIADILPYEEAINRLEKTRSHLHLEG